MGNRYIGGKRLIFFTNKAISMLKTILYARDMEQLPYYLGDPLEGQFDNIVESLDAGAAGLAGFKMEDGHCNATLKIYMENIVDDGGRLHARREKFKVYLYKNLNVPMNLYYSIRKIGCKSCGASFDATRQRSCPSCGSRYEIGDDDWVILKVEKM